MPAIDPDALAGTWWYSHEEDQPGRRVYRRQGYSFPPSRGRPGFELASDGTASTFGPDAADRPGRAAARWALEGRGTLALYAAEDAAPLQTLRIAEHDADKLVVSSGR